MTTISFSIIEREVTAEVPMRTPPGVAADVSPTTAFYDNMRLCQRSSASTTHLVQSDVSQIADLFDLAAGQLEGSEIPQVQMILSAIGLQLVAALDELLSQHLRVLDDLGSVRLEAGLGGLLQCHGDGSDGLYDHSLDMQHTSPKAARTLL
jgi:hypothetical protein